jgi:hypothetical protein
MGEKAQTTKKQKVVRILVYVFAAVLVALVIATLVVSQWPVAAP